LDFYFMLLIFAGLVGGFLLLVLGADGLVRGGTSLALKLGMTPLVVGVTVVSFGTSMPELMVTIQSALADKSDLAVGNVVGSNIANIGLILGAVALVSPIRVDRQLLRFDGPVALIAALAFVFFLSDGTVGRFEGLILFAGIFAYTTFNIVRARRKRAAQIALVEEMSMQRPSAPLWQSSLFVFLGIVGLAAGGHFFVNAAISLARILDVSEAVIGLTIVAVGTSLPELATSMVAAFRGEAEISVGNCIGSNVFNIFCVIGASSLLIPLGMGNVRMMDLLVMVGMSLVILPIMFTGFRISRFEGFLLLVAYAVYMYTLMPS